MPCAQHAFHHDYCARCRDAKARTAAQVQHKERMRQADRHHRQLMARQSGNGSLGSGSGGGFLPMSLLTVAATVLLLGAVVMAVAAAVVGAVLGFASHTVALGLRATFAAIVCGGIAGIVTYVVNRRRHPGSKPSIQVPDNAHPLKDRAVGAYRSLDPITRTTVHVAAGVAAAAFLLTVLI
ncbi:hypothetical protein [Nocardioides aquiterrae]|uniref:Uncharacterized protein n=1 Tax=Nocardioides aquiterrae TaxID=203799 RepID=A0ABP4ETW1_9ACTN